MGYNFRIRKDKRRLRENKSLEMRRIGRVRLD